MDYLVFFNNISPVLDTHRLCLEQDCQVSISLSETKNRYLSQANIFLNTQ